LNLSSSRTSPSPEKGVGGMGEAPKSGRALSSKRGLQAVSRLTFNDILEDILEEEGGIYI